MERRRDQLAPPREEQPLNEPSSTEVHSETPALPEVPQLSLIVEAELFEENISTQLPEDAETEAPHEIPGGPQTEMEQSFTTASLISAPLGVVTGVYPHVDTDKGPALTPEIIRDKGKQRVSYESPQEGPSSA